MDKTVRDVLDDHIALCVLAYARLTVQHSEWDGIENQESNMMKPAIQAASLFTVVAMKALGNPKQTVRVLDLARKLFGDFEDSGLIGEACSASLGLFENLLLNTGGTLDDGVVSRNDISAPKRENALTTPSHRRRRRTPPLR